MTGYSDAEYKQQLRRQFRRARQQLPKSERLRAETCINLSSKSCSNAVAGLRLSASGRQRIAIERTDASRTRTRHPCVPTAPISKRAKRNMVHSLPARHRRERHAAPGGSIFRSFTAKGADEKTGYCFAAFGGPLTNRKAIDWGKRWFL